MALPKVGVEAVVEGMAAFEADAKKVNRAFDDMETGANKLGKGATGLTTHLVNLGTTLLAIGSNAGIAALAGVTALSAGLATFAVGGIKQAIDLDQQVANIAATMGATQETAGTLKEELKGLALDLSLNPNLTVDVTQAGQAIEVLAANGALATDEFGKLTQGSKDLAVQTVALANATGSDFATAATIATDAANIFGLEADEMGKAVDGAAGIMNASKFDANDYALALANSGPVAAGMGVSLEDLNTVVAGTASNFSSGSDAGTSFKTMLQRLSTPTDGMVSLMNEYGISIFDADGKMRDMDVIVGQLHEAFDGLTDAKKAELAATLGGADGSRIILGLAQMTAEEFDALSETVNRTGQGMEAAALRVDTVKGAMDIFRGVLQALQIQVGDKFLPLIKEMAVNFTQFATQNGPMIVEFFGQIATVIANTIDSITVSINKIVGAFQRFGARGAAVSILGQLGLEPEQIATVMSVVDQVTASIDKITGAFERFGLKGATVSIMGQLGLDPETIGLVFTTIDDLTTKISTLQTIFAQFGAMGAGISLLSMLGLSSENIALITTSVQTVIDSFNALSNWWLVTWPVVQASALTGWEILKGIFAGFQAALGPILTQLNTQFTQVFTQLGTTIASFGLEWSDVWNALWTATKIVAAGIGAVILGVIGIVAGLATGIAEAVSAAITMFQNLATSVSGIFVGLTGIVVGFNQTLTALFAGDWPKMWEGAKITLQGFATFFLSLWQGMITVATGSLNVITGLISGFVTGIVDFFKGMYNELVGNSIVPDMINAIVKWFSDLPKKILAGLGDLKKKVTQPFIELSTTIKVELGDAITFVTDDLLPLFIEGFDTVTEGVKNFISSIREAASTLADMVVPDWLQMHSPPPMATAFEMIAKGAGNAGDAIMGMMNSLASTKWSEIRGQVFDLVDDMQDEGHYAAMGYDKSTGHAIKQAFVRAFNESFEGIMSGAISADQLEAITKREAGAYAERVSGNFDAIVKRARESGMNLLMQMQQDLMDALPSMASTLTGLAGNFADLLTKQIEGFKKAKDEAVKFSESIVNLNTKLGEQQVKLQFEQRELGLTQQKLADQKEAQDLLNLSLTEAITQYGQDSEEAGKLREKISDLQLQIDNTTLSIDEKSLAMSKLSEEMDKNRETIEKNEEALAAHRAELNRQALAGFGAFATGDEKLQSDLAMIEQLQEFLKGTGHEFRIIGEELGGIFAGSGLTSDIVFDRVSGQEELNRLLAEQVAREEEITRQKEAQQKLSFLQSQIDLIKMGKELGGNIFSGIRFGLGASSTDLLEATNRIVEAMIGQIDSTLGIASDSKVMIRKFRDDVGGGMIAGLMQVKPMLAGVVTPMLNPMVAGPLSPAMAGAMNSNSYSTTNNFNVGGNNISNGMQAAEFEARVLQVIRRNL